jgi:transcriptional regulator with XRE-family HTH domain
MEKRNENPKHFVVENLIKIMNAKKLTKSAFAETIGFPEPKWNKISNGKQLLSVDEISNIAEKLRMREIDIFTYPKVYVETDKVNSDVKTQITVELKEELKQRVLELVFGNSNLEILNK